MITFSRPRKIGYKTTRTEIRLHGKPIANLIRRFSRVYITDYPDHPKYLWLPRPTYDTVKEAKQAVRDAAEAIHAHTPRE